jgi:uncharacterized protein DUF6624/nudix hydrolase family protein
LVGEDGAHAAWLLAQHADLNPEFQRRCLEFLRQAAERCEASAADLAHLTDRVLLASGSPQLYGTQTTVRNGRYVPQRLRHPEAVDVRRAAIGLHPMAMDLDRDEPPRPARSVCPGCGAPVEVQLPEPDETTRFGCPACGATGSVRTRRTTVLTGSSVAI